jgi:hypothetical protein
MTFAPTAKQRQRVRLGKHDPDYIFDNAVGLHEDVMGLAVVMMDAHDPEVMWRFVRVGGQARGRRGRDRPPPGDSRPSDPMWNSRNSSSGVAIGGTGVAELRAAPQATACVGFSAVRTAAVAGGSCRLTRASAALSSVKAGRAGQRETAGRAARSSSSPPSRGKTRSCSRSTAWGQVCAYFELQDDDVHLNEDLGPTFDDAERDRRANGEAEASAARVARAAPGAGRCCRPAPSCRYRPG